MNKIFLLPVIFFVFASCFNQSNKETESPKQMNLVLITTDDLGKQVSCYGDDIIETLNIDNLAKSGMIFHNANVTQASCSSSRISILTGIYPHTNGHIGLATGFKLNLESNALVSTVDIFPTIMDALGHSFPEEVQGKSLVPVIASVAKQSQTLTGHQ